MQNMEPCAQKAEPPGGTETSEERPRHEAAVQIRTENLNYKKAEV